MQTKKYLLALALAGSVLMVSGGSARAAEEAAKVGGAWEMSVETPRGTNTQTLTIEQEGGSIKGTAKGQRGDAPLTGSVTGNNVSFTVKRETPNGTFTLEYSGTIDGDSMQGTVHSERFDGKWTAKRAAASK